MTDSLLSAARSYATLHHVIRKGQLYGVVPYTHHLDHADRILVRFGETRIVMRVAVWLHDIVEDTDVKIRDVEENFGEEVAGLVAAVTSEEGPNRRVRNALTYPKIRAAGRDAVRLKLADRLSHIENGGASVRMYAKEYPEFRHALWSPSGVDSAVALDDINTQMWHALDDLIGNR